MQGRDKKKSAVTSCAALLVLGYVHPCAFVHSIYGKNPTVEQSGRESNYLSLRLR
jgi:hypothetical protein